MGPLHIHYAISTDPDLYGENVLPEAAESYAEQLAERMGEVILEEYPDAVITTGVLAAPLAAARGSEAWYTDDAGNRIERAPAVIERLDGILAQNWDAWCKNLVVE
jgi:hypothetical protein